MAKKASKKAARSASRKATKKPTRQGRAANSPKKAKNPSKSTPTNAASSGAEHAAAAGGSRESASASAELGALRTKIDRLDTKLISLLNERANAVVEIGTLKRGSGTPIYAPHREREVLAKALAANAGPLPDRTIEGIYREMMSGAFALEQPLRSGYLGPPGSQSHVAAGKQFGSSVEYDNLHEIGGVFTEVRRGHVNYGLVPIENSTGGGIAEALDAFCAVAEGGSHFVYFTFCGAQMERPVSQFELELQAEIDKYLLLRTTHASDELLHRLFERFELDETLSSEQRERYRLATEFRLCPSWCPRRPTRG